MKKILFLRVFLFWFLLLTLVSVPIALVNGINFFCEGIWPCHSDGRVSDTEVLERLLLASVAYIATALIIAKIRVTEISRKRDNEKQ